MNWKYILVLIILATLVAGIIIINSDLTGEELSETSQYGTIEGSLGYPSEEIPEDIRVCARNVKTQKEYCTKNHVRNEKYKYGVGYKVKVPAGNYYLIASRSQFESEESLFRGHYTEYVTCGLKEECDSHESVQVGVEGGEVVSNVDMLDWFRADDMKGWKTYRNEEMGFEVKYPVDWVVKEGRTEKEISFGQEKEVELENQDEEQKVFKSGFTVVFYEDQSDLPSNINNLSLEDWLDKEYSPL